VNLVHPTFTLSSNRCNQAIALRTHRECNGDISPITNDSVELSVVAVSWKQDDGARRGDTAMP
jgi:hypothetical protein